MQDPDAKRDIDREMAALFAGAEAPPEADDQFVAGVISRIRRRERMRWWVLGGAALIASVIALPAVWELLTAWGAAEVNLLADLNNLLVQAGAQITAFMRTAVRSVTFLTATALAITIIPLLRWLAD